MHAGASCGQSAEGKDLFGGNLEALPQDTATADQCLQICLDTAGCNGFSWLGGNCYLKSVGAAVEFTDRPGTTAYRVCPEDVKPAPASTPPAATPSTASATPPPSGQGSDAATPTPTTPAQTAGAFHPGLHIWPVSTACFQALLAPVIDAEVQ